MEYLVQFDSRTCSNNPCLNNGTCLNSNLNNTITELVCQCELNYYGVYCENKIDLCQNQTCSNNGYCFLNNTQPICKCFNGYNGDICELDNVSLKNVMKCTNLFLPAHHVGQCPAKYKKETCSLSKKLFYINSINKNHQMVKY